MKDEIKEILDYLKDDKWDYYPSDGIPYKVLLMEERDKLLDYITNLQEENKSLHTRIKTIKRRRKEQTAKIRKYREEITNKQNSNKDYKQRIDKSIEDLKKTKELNDKHILARDNIVVHLDIDHIDYLLNILQGKSDE